MRDNALPWPRIESFRLGRTGIQVTLDLGAPDAEENPLERIRIRWGDGSLADEILKPRGMITCRHTYAAGGAYKIIVTPYAGPRSPCDSHEFQISTVPALVCDRTMQFGTKGLDRLHGIAVDRQGSIYLAGEIGDMTPLALEPGSVFLVKCSAAGEQEWVAQCGRANEVPGGLALDQEGNPHLATYDSCSDPKQPVLLRKYSPNSELLRTLALEDERPLRGLVTDSRGDHCFYAQERWRRDVLSWQCVLAERHGGIEAGRLFARVPEGQTMTFPIKNNEGKSQGEITLASSRKPDLRKISIQAQPPEAGIRESQPRYIHPGCTEFKDPESVYRKNPITWVKVCHGGYIHGFQLGYGCQAGSFHGYQEAQLTVSEWTVPDSEKIVRVEGQVAKNSSGLLYLSRLQFVTDKGSRSPQFGGNAGAAFTAEDPQGLPLRTISGWANLTRHSARNRAVAAMDFLFGPSVDWQAYLPEDVSIQAVAADGSGGLYVCGYHRGGRMTAEESLDHGCFVARYHPDGELHWLRRHGGNENDQSVAIAADGLGNAYVADLAAGRTEDTPNRGRFDARLVKYDSEGRLIWMRQFGTRLFDVPFSVVARPGILEGGEPGEAQAVYVTGVTQGDLYDETKDLDPASKLKAFLIAFDSEGTRFFLDQFSLGAEVPQEVLDLELPTRERLKQAYEAATHDPEEAKNLIFRAAPPEIRHTWWRLLPVSILAAAGEEGSVYLAGGTGEGLAPNYRIKGGADIFLMRFVPNPEYRQ